MQDNMASVRVQPLCAVEYIAVLLLLLVMAVH
jgi:hypothetical protein